MAGMLPIPAATTMPPAQSPPTMRPRPALVTNVHAALSHQRDFAKAFVGLLGHPAIGDTFHITSDEWLSWNEIFRIVAHAVRVEAIWCTCRLMPSQLPIPSGEQGCLATRVTG